MTTVPNRERRDLKSHSTLAHPSLGERVTPDDGLRPSRLRVSKAVREIIEPQSLDRIPLQLSGGDSLELLVEVAHDLRSPLTSILFLAETLQRGQSGAVNDLQNRQLGLIYGAAFGLSTIVSDVIELARGGDQLVEREPSPLSVSEIFESVRDIVRPMAEEKGLAVRLRAPATDHRVGHPLALSRVLLNLTTNALKFTEKGSVELSGREAGRSHVEFSVRDTGKGIKPQVLDDLFRAFRPGPGRTGRGFSGTGLGLMICRRLVEAMGSELRVESHAGRGTRFFFDLELPPASQR